MTLDLQKAIASAAVAGLFCTRMHVSNPSVNCGLMKVYMYVGM